MVFDYIFNFFFNLKCICSCGLEVKCSGWVHVFEPLVTAGQDVGEKSLNINNFIEESWSLRGWNLMFYSPSLHSAHFLPPECIYTLPSQPPASVPSLPVTMSFPIMGYFSLELQGKINPFSLKLPLSEYFITHIGEKIRQYQ